MAVGVSSTRDDLIGVYLAHWRSLCDRLSYHTKSPDIAEEALQETWIRLDALPDDKQRLPIRDRQAFILRVASNIAVDLFRRERRHGARAISDEAVLAAIADATPGPETIAIDRDHLRQLVIALATLPPKARYALLLNRCEGLSHGEIAKRLGVSQSMVAKYLAQALRHCRDHFRHIGSEN
ncbi:RNA polymerase sigma factor [Devosia yakushimensis]|nr:RNA polymerase sigma factor [Devosia yakushimensis]